MYRDVLFIETTDPRLPDIICYDIEFIIGEAYYIFWI